ncbi:MAG TPA: MFS transporter, partial [Thermodesulfobacteriota bacterium]|nr:MFS transporter [Thermodesulfobacteriota bacterium]
FTLPEIGGGYWTTFFPAIAVLGVGMAITISPLTTAVMSSIDLEHSGVASGINNSVGRIAGLLSVAILGVFALSGFNRNLDKELRVLDLNQETIRVIESQRIKLAAIDIPESLPDPVKREIRSAISDSFLGAFRLMMKISAGLVFLGAVTAWLTIEKNSPD